MLPRQVSWETQLQPEIVRLAGLAQDVLKWGANLSKTKVSLVLLTFFDFDENLTEFSVLQS